MVVHSMVLPFFVSQAVGYDELLGASVNAAYTKTLNEIKNFDRNEFNKLLGYTIDGANILDSMQMPDYQSYFLKNVQSKLAFSNAKTFADVFLNIKADTDFQHAKINYTNALSLMLSAIRYTIGLYNNDLQVFDNNINDLIDSKISVNAWTGPQPALSPGLQPTTAEIQSQFEINKK